MSPPRFVVATGESGQQWIDKAARGQVVTVAERNAFVWQAAAAMDVLADPQRLAGPTGPRVETTPYNGPVTAANGRMVPVVGGIAPPPQWFGKGDTSRKGSGRVHRAAGEQTLADILAPTNAERRALWLATANLMRQLEHSGRAQPSASGDAGLAPLAIGAIVVCVLGVSALAAWVTDSRGRIQEDAATARHAQNLRAAQEAWMARVQEQLRTGRSVPPSPAEQAVTTQTTAEAEATRARANSPRTPFDLEAFARDAERALWIGGAVLGAATIAPPILANIADRVTRAPANRR